MSKKDIVRKIRLAATTITMQRVRRLAAAGPIPLAMDIPIMMQKGIKPVEVIPDF